MEGLFTIYEGQSKEIFWEQVIRIRSDYIIQIKPPVLNTSIYFRSYDKGITYKAAYGINDELEITGKNSFVYRGDNWQAPGVIEFYDGQPLHRTIKASSIDELDREITRYLRNGWSFRGAKRINVRDEYFLQAMVRDLKSR